MKQIEITGNDLGNSRALHLDDHGYADYLNHDLDDAPERPLSGAVL